MGFWGYGVLGVGIGVRVWWLGVMGLWSLGGWGVGVGIGVGIGVGLILSGFGRLLLEDISPA